MTFDINYCKLDKQDLHVHSIYSDGNDTLHEMVLKAISLGLERIGFSDHSYTAFDGDVVMKYSDYPAYKNAIYNLKKEFKGKIEILCGIEQDYFSDISPEGFDYIIGSVHELKISNDIFAPIDVSRESLIETCQKYFKNDFYALVEEYYSLAADVINKTGADIIGHFDLITKFNEGNLLFDQQNPRYVNAWKSAADYLLKYGKPFEINTGAVSKGWKSVPYPSNEIFEYIKGKGGKFIFSSDAHTAENIAFGFSKLNSIS